jgi:hypothetical protein
MVDPQRAAAIRDLSVLTVFSLACTIAAATGSDGSAVGAAIAAVGLGGLLAYGWSRVLRSSKVAGSPTALSSRRLGSTHCVETTTASFFFEAKESGRPADDLRS